MSPAAATEQYRRVLTDYEMDEIRRYPNVYFVGPTARKIHGGPGKGPNCGYDDAKNRYRCIKNDHLAYRYEVLRGLGKGSFGDVIKAYDHKTKTHVAVKVIRNERRFHKQAESEIRILDLIRRQDKKNKHNLVHMKDTFTFRGHICITFELMQSDLYAALKKTHFAGFEPKVIQEYSKQLITALRVLRRSRIIHCDLKPENILIKGAGRPQIKVIDFGSSCFDSQKVHTYIQSRFYRSPEVILGFDYGTPIDMWSLGCIMAELHSGRPLFPGSDEKEQLLYQMEVLDVPPEELLTRGSRSAKYFVPGTSTPLYTSDRKGRKRTPGTRALSRAVGSTEPAFLDFIARCLTWDPAKRMTPREAAHHWYITGGPADDSVTPLAADKTAASCLPGSRRRDSRAAPGILDFQPKSSQKAAQSRLNADSVTAVPQRANSDGGQKPTTKAVAVAAIVSETDGSSRRRGKSESLLSLGGKSCEVSAAADRDLTSRVPQVSIATSSSDELSPSSGSYGDADA